MKAAVLKEIGQPLHIEEVDRPEAGEGEVLVKIEASGVCHSDLHLADGDWPGALSTVTEPLILGHEIVGIVAALGPNAAGFAIGDRVGMGWLCETCGECDYCREGDENICKRRQVTGLAIPGGYAEYFKAKASHLLKVPTGLDPAQAAPLFCAGVTVYRAVTKANLQPGERAAVFGVGGLGHLAVQLVKNTGAETIAVDVGEDQLELARSLGADHVFSAEEAVQGIRSLGRVHAAVVTAAARPAYDAAFQSLRKKGTLVVVGLPKEEVGFIADDFVTGEYRILGSAVGTREDIRATLALAAQGKLQCHIETVPLDQINETFTRLRQGEVTGRVVLTF